MPFATVTQIPELPDGIYDITVYGESQKFLVHTVTSGALSGQRIVKMRSHDVSAYGGWKGFANLVMTDVAEDVEPVFERLYIWTRMRDRVTNSYILGVTLAIKAFIDRVNDRPESTFIVINDCPEIPQHVRDRLNPPVLTYQDLPTVTEEVRLTGAFFSAPGEYIGRVRSSRATATPVRVRAIAMSYFDRSVVR